MEFFAFYIEYFALAFFVICLLLSIYFRKKARRLERESGKKIRSYYRRSWVEFIIKKQNQHLFLETIRNSILVSAALITGLAISFGFVINSTLGLHSNESFVSNARLFLAIGLMAYAFFINILKIRTLVYLPVILGTDENLIKKYEKMSKIEYLAKLFHDSFDHFSNTIRALFFIVALLAWCYNVYVFIAFTLIITYIMVREDLGSRSEITIF